MTYVITVRGRRRRFDTLDEACKVANAIFTHTGIVVGIEAL